MKAGRELDALVAEKVMGHDMEKDFCTTCYDSPTCDRPIPRYSILIQDAWPVVEKMADRRHPFELVKTPISYWVCRFYGEIIRDIYKGYADTAPLAICLAALKAVEAT